MRGPSTMPGKRAFTRTPNSPSSLARLALKPTIAHFVAAYGVRYGVAEPARDGRNVEQHARSRAQHRRGAAGAQELAGEVDVDRTLPIGGRDRVDCAGRPGDSRVIHQHVEAAQLRRHVGEEAIDGRFVADVGVAPANRWLLATARFEGIRGVITDVHARTVCDERVDDGAADSGGAGRNENTQTIDEQSAGIHTVVFRRTRNYATDDAAVDDVTHRLWQRLLEERC